MVDPSERMFYQNRCSRGNNFATQTRLGLVLCAMLCGLIAGCLAEPRRVELAQLLERLVVARAALSATPPRTESICDDVGDVGSRLEGEPGLVDVRLVWPALRASADALEAVCGQAVLLQQPSTESAAMLAARQRWQRGIGRELLIACERMREAATELGRSAPC